MNCVQGDLAYVKAGQAVDELVGRFVICVRLYQGEVINGAPVTRENMTKHGPIWIVKAAREGELLPQYIGHYNIFGNCIRREVKMCAEVLTPDAWLRPIRDPGEDAKDEMIRPLPANAKIVAAAAAAHEKLTEHFFPTPKETT